MLAGAATAAVVHWVGALKEGEAGGRVITCKRLWSLLRFQFEPDKGLLDIMVDLGTSLDELHVMKVRVFLHERDRRGGFGGVGFGEVIAK